MYDEESPLPPGGEAETGKGPVDLFSAERAQTILLRPGGNSRGEGKPRQTGPHPVLLPEGEGTV